MPYIPEEHKKYPVLPYSREHGGEVFQYHEWPERELLELIGDHLIPYGYKSYESYFEKIDRYIQQYADNPRVVWLLTKGKEKMIEWNKKEEWSICRYLGEDTDNVFGLHKGGYYYWPCTTANPVFGGVIDDEEFTAYLYPTDSSLWEIAVDPTGMARRTMSGGENAMSQMEFSYIMEQLKDTKPEELKQVETLGPVPRLNECKKKIVRYLGEETTALIPNRIYTATVLEDGSLLIGDGKKVNKYDADRFEVICEEGESMEKVTFDGYIDYDEAEKLARVSTLEGAVPVNISLEEDSDWDLKEGELCNAQLWSNDYSVTVYPSEEEYSKADTHMAPISMIPMGTFPADPDQKDFKQSAMILFTGIVKEVERNPDPEDGAPVWRLRIETYAMAFDLYYFEDELIEPGFLVHGQLWLYGTLKRAAEN